MIAPLTATDRAQAANTAGSTGPLQAQLQKCQTELSSWVNCDSAKTSSGQARIAALQAQVQAIEQRLARVREAAQPAAPTPAAAPAPGSGPLGNILDVYA
ncbi:MAG: hypothetical protein JF607_09125 [Burkholderiales bacterium]|jgi:hypothetical protein|nr:hypothetical protein [Burkholderiales bacterium]